MNIFWEQETAGFFLIVFVALSWGAAYLTGRAMAITWRPIWMVVVYMAILTGAVRFFHYSLFDGSFFFYFDQGRLHPTVGFYYYAIDLVVLMAIAYLGYRVTRSGQMAAQYRWLYSRAGPLSWRQRPQ